MNIFHKYFEKMNCVMTVIHEVKTGLKIMYIPHKVMVCEINSPAIIIAKLFSVSYYTNKVTI